MTLAEWLRDALRRLRPHKTQAGLAAALGRDASVVSKILADTRKVKADELRVIVRYLGETVPSELVSQAVEEPHVTRVPSGLSFLPLVPSEVLATARHETIMSLRADWMGETVPLRDVAPAAFGYRMDCGCLNLLMPLGAVVAVDPGDRDLVPGAVYLMRYGGAVCMREYRDDGVRRFVPRSTEDGHAELFPDATPGIEVLGRARTYSVDLN